MHQPTMMTTLAAPCTPRDPIYISLFDDCEGGSDDTVKKASGLSLAQGTRPYNLLVHIFFQGLQRVCEWMVCILITAILWK